MSDFISSILPTQGYYCVAEQTPQAMRHYWHDNTEDVLRRIAALDQNPSHQIYLAQATFVEAGNTFSGRKRGNASHLRNFFLDIDCGPTKAYPTQRDGILALKGFCEKAALPIPAVVKSGNGLYAHWKLLDDLAAPTWKAAAGILQSLVKRLEAGLDADGICADTARILRPIGATHRKDPNNPKTVSLVANSTPLSSTDFIGLLHAAARTHKLLEAYKPPKPDAAATLNAAFNIEYDHDPSSALLIAQKCAQVAYLRDTKGDVAEPLWYGSIGLLRFTTEAQEIIHAWSSGHADYSPEATDTKIRQHEASRVGPTTCKHFESLNPSLCVGCKYKTKVSTPLILGRAAPQPLKQEELPQEDVLPEPPKGFTISKGGIHYLADEGTPVQCYPYPLYITAINADWFGESVTIKHYLPFEGWQEVVIPSSATQDAKKFFSILVDSHIHVVGRDQKGLFMSYFEMFMSKVRNASQIKKLAMSMGWHGVDGALTFTHGAETYHLDGEVTTVGYSSSAPDWLKALQAKGGTDEWIENTKLLNAPGMEGLAFEFLVAAFGSPLVHFTGYSGAMVSVVGDSGVGKTITGKWGLSAWGNPEKLALMRDDTRNALLARLGVYGSLPAYVDEVSNISSEELSEMVYRITQGREKIRLDKSAKEKKHINSWQMLAVVSSNQSLMDKLINIKGDAGAELNRVFEYEVYSGFNKTDAQKIVRTYTDNYGQIGKQYAHHLTMTQLQHQDKLDQLSVYIDHKSRAESGERFWTMIGAVAIYGGSIAQKLGLSHVDVQRLVPWICEKIADMRKYKKTHTFDALSWLGSFFDRHVGDFIVVKSYTPNQDFAPLNHQREPRSKLIGRIEEDQLKMWVSVDAMKRELHREQISYRKLVQMLKSSPGGSILKEQKRMTLGRGTIYASVSQTCWEIDLDHPELGHKFMVSVKNAEAAERLRGAKK